MEIMLPLTVKVIYDSASSDAPFVAYTPELDVASCGPSEEKARKNLHEAVEIIVEEARRKGKLEDLLREMGFQKEKRSWKPPRISLEPFLFRISR